MDQGNESMMEVYLFETNDLLEHLDEILLACEKNSAFDNDSVNEIFRIMHTIKGSSAMMEFTSLAEVAHRMEDLFAFVRENGVSQEEIGSLTDLMFKSGDFLKEELEKVRAGQPLTDDIGSLMQEINDFLKKISGGNAGAPKAAAVPAAAASSPASPKKTEGKYPFALRVFFDQDAQMENLRAFMLTNTVRDVCEDFRYYPENIENDASTVDDIMKEGFWLYFLTKEDRARAIPTVAHFPYTRTYSEAETPAPEKEKAAAAPQAHAAVKQDLINVSLSRLDELMNLMGEIVITESMVISDQTTQQEGFDNNFSKASRRLRKLTDEMQEIVMSIRMVPVSTVFQKMNRIVRDMSKKLNKEARLVLVGEDTEVDKTIVDNISDPIMHLVRNAMDHGIETREDRAKTGKPAEGTVTLSAKNSGGYIQITVADDGAGIDRAAVVAKAKKNGLLTKPAEEYTDREVYQFLLMPGFSTNSVVTEFSGRGVGMDVVKKNVEKMGGDVVVESTPGKGMKAVFKIPLTLAIINGMKVTVGGTMFTIPIHNIVQSFKARGEDIVYDTDGREIIKVRGRYFPVVRLCDVYGIPEGIKNVPDGIMILVGNRENAFCLFADNILGEQQVVVKALPEYMVRFGVRKSGIDGCAILGDGSISLILNVQNLYSCA